MLKYRFKNRDFWRTGKAAVAAAAVSLLLPPVGTVGAAWAQAQAVPTASTAGTATTTTIVSPAAARPGLLAEIPFTLRNNWVVLNVRVGKDEGEATAAKAPVLHFLLDTGATGTLLSQESLEANHLALPQATQAKDGKRVVKVVGSGDSSGVDTRQQLEAMLHLIGSRPPFASVPEMLVVLPLGVGFQHLKVDGLLGNSFVGRFVTEVDYAAQVVRLYDPSMFTPPQASEGFSALPLHFDSQNIPLVDAEVTPLGYSTTPLRLTVDTGGGRGGTVTLHSPFVQKKGWQNILPRTIPLSISGLGGQASAFIGRLRDIRLGGATLIAPSVIFSQTSTGLLAQSESDGRIGGDLLRRFTAIFDYPHKRLYLRPNLTTPFPPMRYYGFHYLPPVTATGGYRIELVDADSPAALAGVHVGDVLCAVDGRAVASLDLDALRDLLDAIGTERTLEVGSANGKTRRQVKITGITY